MTDAVKLTSQDGVAIVTIDNPPVNALSRDVLDGLGKALDAALGDASLSALVLTGAGGNFVAGADVGRLERIAAGAPIDDPSSTTPRLPDLIARLETSEKPSVAAIDGFALGGGLELALGCHARVGTPRARVGLPELKLGLIPGAGGTQRLPRLIGVAAAVDAMLTSRQLRAAEAEKLGVLDAIADESELVSRAIALALEIRDGRRPRRETLRRSDALEPDALEILARAHSDAAKKFRNVGYATACLDAIASGLEHGAEQGLLREREAFVAALGTEAARGLIHLFFAERAAAKVPGVTDSGLRPQKIERVAVIGGGTMGSGIATALLDANFGVLLKEASDELGQSARARIAKNFERSVEKGRKSRADADAALGRLALVSDTSGFQQVDLVIEAATENVALKKEIFAELARVTRPGAWLATNTSTIDVAVVAEAAGQAERVLGMHFFSPAHVMPLLELVQTNQTAPQALSDVLALAKRIGKTAVTVRSAPGFLVNRVFMPYGQITGFLIDRGVDPYRIDRALFGFGMPMGPCRMSDLAGIDVGVAAGGILDAAFPDRAYRSQLRRLLAEAGRTGEKSGRGHYRHEAGKALEDPELADFVAEARRLAGSPPTVTIDDEEITRLVLGGVVNEACRAIDEGVVIRASDVDVAAALGMGFPRYRGGPMKWADGLGALELYDLFSRWHDATGLGLFSPSARLKRCASDGASLLGARDD
jgi:enoyl-CoA hydratase/3-hydroxyacyl-CoA dehydrogenase